MEVDDLEDLRWLFQLVQGCFEDEDDYPEALAELVQPHLVAHKYCFEAIWRAAGPPLCWR